MAIRIEVTGNNAAEVIRDLLRLTTTLNQTGPTEPADKTIDNATTPEPPAPPAPKAAPVAEAKADDPESTRTLEEIRKLAVDRSRAFGNKAVKEILQNYGVDKITDLRPEAYDLVYADLEAMA